MFPISAADCVSPAVQRTKEFLFRPFSWGTYLKLGLVAIITEGIGDNFRSSNHGGHGKGPESIGFSPSSLTPEIIAVIVVAALVVLVFSLFVLYLITRLRFTFFHCLIHNVKQLRPGWQLYRAQAMRFFWLNIVVGLCFMLLLALIAIPFAAGFWRVFQETQRGGQPDVLSVLALVLPLIPIFLLLVLAGALADLILRDGMLPHFALDNATAGEAWARVWAHIKAEKRQFAVYALLRIVLPILAMIGLFFLLLLPGLGLAAALASVEFGVHSIFADAAGASVVVGVLLEIFFGVVAFVFAALASICIGGPVSTAIREYALIFYGGRYKALGDILYPPTPPAMARGTSEVA
ncbi:MAG TPA: hypothetical protein VJX73_06575 [Terracidiphilus sp.]|nr:hypothetical protein [Terracidiphilus sp.]